MFSTYVDEYQKQVSDWQTQFNEWQKKYFDTWLGTLETARTDGNLSESFDKTLNLQEEMVRSYLETQEKTTRMMLDTQKKFWDNYFQSLRQRATTV